MGALTVVLLAEGSGDLGENSLRGPGSPIHDDDFGPAHVLFARAISDARKLPRAAIRFVEPLRTRRATLARGSALKQRQSLRQLINYLPASRPELIIVLVDADGDLTTSRTLSEFVADVPGTKVIAVAVQEFEAWLISNPKPEAMKPREAKEQLAALLASAEDPRAARRTIAENLDLAETAKRCPSFGDCLKQLATRP